MATERFEALPKKDRDRVETYVAMRPDLLRPTEFHADMAGQTFRNNRAALRERPARDGYAFHSSGQMFAGECLFLASTLEQRAIALRLMDGDVSGLAAAATALGRLAYVEQLASDPAGDSDEGLHTRGVTQALAAGDWDAATAFVRRYPQPSRREHGSGRNIWNRIAHILRPVPELAQTIAKPLPKLGPHDLGAVQALDGIIGGDEALYRTGLTAVLDNHARTQTDGALRRYHPTLAYALCRLAERKFPSPQLLHRLWDDEFYAATPRPFDWQLLTPFSPDLPDLAISLPDTVRPAMFDDI